MKTNKTKDELREEIKKLISELNETLDNLKNDLDDVFDELYDESGIKIERLNEIKERLQFNNLLNILTSSGELNLTTIF